MVAVDRAVMQGMLLAFAAGCSASSPPGVDASTAPGAAFLYAGGGSAINVFRMDLATGALTFRAEVPAGDNAYLADADARRTHAYVQTQVGLPVTIRAFDIQDDGALKPVAEQVLPHPFVEGMTEILLDPGGRWLLMSSTGGSSGLLDQLMPVGADGQLGPARIISSDFYGFAWDPSGRYLFGLDGVAIRQYRFDAAAGTIAAATPVQAEGSLGHQILGLQAHPGGRWIYSVEETAIGVFAFDADKGTLTGLGYVRNVVPGDAITWASLVVHPGGRFLYALGNVAGSLLAVIDLFAIDPATGGLTFVGRQEGGDLHGVRLGSLQGPLLVGDLLVIGGQGVVDRFRDRPVLCVYRIRPEDGVLTPVGEPVPLRPAATTNVSFILGKIVASMDRNDAAPAIER
jgi:6-phosphogluconolactonase (cycloisomerase 2 family)